MGYHVAIERTTECPTAVVKHDTRWRDVARLWRPSLDEVWAFIRTSAGLWTGGHNVMLYRRDHPGVEVAAEFGVQVTRAFPPSGRVVSSSLPAGETATTLHSGSPAEIGDAHAAVQAWCVAHGRAPTGVSWEIYGDPDPGSGHFDVKIHWQLG